MIILFCILIYIASIYIGFWWLKNMSNKKLKCCEVLIGGIWFYLFVASQAMIISESIIWLIS